MTIILILAALLFLYALIGAHIKERRESKHRTPPPRLAVDTRNNRWVILPPRKE